jgi:predicted nucleic acid-binding protein
MELLGFLPQISIAQDKEVQQFVTKQRLFGRGLGWIDCHLLAACRLHGSELYTLDRALMTAFKEIAD